MMMIRCGFCFVFLLLFTEMALCCSFKIEGYDKSQSLPLRTALSSITNELEFDEVAGVVHFLSKEHVLASQVEAALKANALEGVTVKEYKKQK